MYNNKQLAITFSTAIITLNSSVLMAADDTNTSLLPPVWPLLALIIIVVVFRKQLNCVPPLNLDEKPVPPSPTATVAKTNTTAETTTTAEINTTAETTAAPKTTETIDLKDGLKQCQASTAKGTRCKRVTTLEDARITIGKKTYLLTVCKQHNTAGMKPYSGLIKKAKDRN